MPININELTVSASGKTRLASGLDPLQQALTRVAQLEAKVAVLQSAIEVLQSALEVNDFGTTLKGRSFVMIRADHLISMQSGGAIDAQSAGHTDVSANQFRVSAAQIKGSTAVADFSGFVKCSTLQATNIVGSNYTPGVGNLA